jgi:hypothetical protein
LKSYSYGSFTKDVDETYTNDSAASMGDEENDGGDILKE